MRETGAIKFAHESSGHALAAFPGFEALDAAREELRRMGLLGVEESGIAFGNVSLRDGMTDSFYITGSGTGGLSALTPQDCAKVVAYDFERNWLRCEGRVIASAESFTHAAIYAMDPQVRAVIHGHNHALWRGLVERSLSTRPDVPYGTPEVAREVQRLFRETNVRTKKIFAMAGHEAGIVAFGPDLRHALDVLIAAGTLSR
ncbi:MAG TPA: class II aldolase/adducin family protein [Chthoniobacterales bacterium]|jgi:ribulose-5-phosphate 4-epimerase/fuculose-1-phosphate aldolase